MLHTLHATRGMVVAPHGLAAESGAAVLREGGTAAEAAVAVAATLAVIYPHMTGIGGDSFWLLREPGGRLHGIDAAGAAGAGVSVEAYRAQGLDAVPRRGAMAAITVAGTVAGWERLLAADSGRLPRERLLADAIHYAEVGYPVTDSQAQATAGHYRELTGQPGFADAFLCEGRAPAAGDRLRQPRLAETLRVLARDGFDTFYKGTLAEAVAGDLDRVGSPLTRADLHGHTAARVEPLSLALPGVRVYNMPPPTQGVASLMILGIVQRLGDLPAPGSTDYVHRLVEATKQAFKQRDRVLCDPREVPEGSVEALLSEGRLDTFAQGIDPSRAAPWRGAGDTGDTTWFGVIDGEGRAVSAIQSLYQAFGSGVVLPETGICWQNRGSAFGLDERRANALRPGRRPPHTLNPAAAAFDDGRFMVYGAMGGDGQPQTQAAIFTRYAVYGQGLQTAVTAPRWLLGRAWGESSNTLKLESRFDPAVPDELARRGHAVVVLGAFESLMGHAGALVHRPDGVIEGAGDPRSDGGPVGY